MSQHAVLDTLASKSMAADFDSLPIRVEQFDTAFLEVIWSGSDAATTLKLQGRIDSGAWLDLDDDCFQKTLAAGAGADGFELGELQSITFDELRASFTAGSATAGMITIRVRRKSIRRR